MHAYKRIYENIQKTKTLESTLRCVDIFYWSIIYKLTVYPLNSENLELATKTDNL